MYYLQMMLAILALAGIALLIWNLLQTNLMESMVLASASVVVVLFLSSYVGSFQYGFCLLVGISVLGIFLFLLRLLLRGRASDFGKEAFPPAFVMLLVVYIVSMFLMKHDFIQHVDELHYWAAAVKYMLVNDRLPIYDDFIGGIENAHASGLFILFFQKFTGYCEGAMYAASGLLAWIGFLLPFHEHSWKDWKKTAVYIGMISVAMYSLYVYGMKSLYVDAATAAWSGGLAVWWMHRTKKKSDWAVLLSGLVMLYYLKPYVGFLMVVCLAVFVFVHAIFVERDKDGKRSRTFVKGSILFCLFILAASLVTTKILLTIEPYVPSAEEQEAAADSREAGSEEPQWMIAGRKVSENFATRITVVGLSTDKIKGATASFFTKCFGMPLSPRSNWAIAFVPFIAIMLMLCHMLGELYGEAAKYRVLKCWLFSFALYYAAVLYFAYLLVFTHDIGSEARSANRYFSICGIVVFVFVLGELFQKKKAVNGGKWRYLLAVLVTFFVLGLNEKFIPTQTALAPENVPNYEELQKARLGAEQVDTLTKDDDKIYYICQYPGETISKAEAYNAMVLYQLQNKVSNYIQAPWKFTEEDMGIVGIEEVYAPLDGLPLYCKMENCNYVWIHMSDQYLRDTLPQRLQCDPIIDNGFYKVVYDDAKIPVGLELVTTVYDNIEESAY